jgi:hypothetical protein
MITSRIFPVVAAALFLVSACGEQASEPTKTSEPAAMPRTPSPAGARAFFITPTDGETVSSPVRIEFGIEGMDVVPAGVNEMNSGHHHLIVDADLPDDMGMPIPADDHYIHFGDASTSTEIALESGQHTLKLLLGDHLHIPHDPPVTSETITITVE